MNEVSKRLKVATTLEKVSGIMLIIAGIIKLMMAFDLEVSDNK